MKSSEELPFAAVSAIYATVEEAWKKKGFNGVWTYDLTMPVWCYC